MTEYNESESFSNDLRLYFKFPFPKFRQRLNPKCRDFFIFKSSTVILALNRNRTMIISTVSGRIQHYPSV
jgi:hypothetical protein